VHQQLLAHPAGPAAAGLHRRYLLLLLRVVPGALQCQEGQQGRQLALQLHARPPLPAVVVVVAPAAAVLQQLMVLLLLLNLAGGHQVVLLLGLLLLLVWLACLLVLLLLSWAAHQTRSL
jgi:hypothetical protein